MSDLGLDTLRSVDEAIAILDALPVTVRKSVPPVEMSPRPLLSEGCLADRDYPPFDKALVDGYAVHAADLGAANVDLPCVGEIAAGHPWSGDAIVAGTCVAIMTGAPLPPGVDAVIPVEETTPLDGGRRVRFGKTAKVGRSIACRGSEAKAGDVVLTAGLAIGPAQVAAVAQVGGWGWMRDAQFADDAVEFHEWEGGPAAARAAGRLTAAILVTGDEIVDGANDPGPAGIRDTNGPMLQVLLRSLGVSYCPRSRVADDPAAVREAIDRLSREHDFLFVTGGMSMGRHDHVPATLRDLGFALPITKVRMKPGKPFVLATRGASIVFGLPGNPVAVFVCTLRLAARVIRRTRGLPPGGDVKRLKLAASLPANGPREFYQPATLDADGCVTPLEWKGSADVFALARADALIVRPADDPSRTAGDRVATLAIPR